jgi:hypothetical protein
MEAAIRQHYVALFSALVRRAQPGEFFDRRARHAIPGVSVSHNHSLRVVLAEHDQGLARRRSESCGRERCDRLIPQLLRADAICQCSQGAGVATAEAKPDTDHREPWICFR